MKKITQDNWLSSSNNDWSFQNVQSLFPTARIKRGTKASSILPADLQSIGSIQIDDVEGNKQSLDEMLSSTQTDAFLVLKDGKILFEEYFHGMGPDSLHLMNSITKSFVGVLTGILSEKGIIDINDKLTQYLPKFADTGFSDTTFQTALDMASSVKFEEDYAEPLCDFWNEAAVVGWRPDLSEGSSHGSLHDFALSLKEKEQEENEGYHYRTVLTNVIALAIQEATNLRFQDLLEEHIWQKLSPEQDAVIVVDKEGFPYVGAGMNACARDLARFGQMILGGGVFQGQRIISESWIESTWKGDDGYRERFAKTDHGLMMPGGHYKNQMWIPSSEIMMCIGIFGQTILVNKSTDVVVVKFSSFPEPAHELMFANTFLLTEAISNLV